MRAGAANNVRPHADRDDRGHADRFRASAPAAHAADNFRTPLPPSIAASPSGGSGPGEQTRVDASAGTYDRLRSVRRPQVASRRPRGGRGLSSFVGTKPKALRTM